MYGSGLRVAGFQFQETVSQSEGVDPLRQIGRNDKTQRHVGGFTAFQQLTRYYEMGHLGTDQTGAYNLFLTQKAAMWLIGSYYCSY